MAELGRFLADRETGPPKSQLLFEGRPIQALTTVRRPISDRQTGELAQVLVQVMSSRVRHCCLHLSASMGPIEWASVALISLVGFILPLSLSCWSGLNVGASHRARRLAVPSHVKMPHLVLAGRTSHITVIDSLEPNALNKTRTIKRLLFCAAKMGAFAFDHNQRCGSAASATIKLEAPLAKAAINIAAL